MLVLTMMEMFDIFRDDGSLVILKLYLKTNK